VSIIPVMSDDANVHSQRLPAQEKSNPPIPFILPVVDMENATVREFLELSGDSCGSSPKQGESYELSQEVSAICSIADSHAAWVFFVTVCGRKSIAQKKETM
jgi:hypothetical protein